MSEFSITCSDFEEGGEIPKKFGYKFENEIPNLHFENIPKATMCVALIMDDPDAMGAVGKVWVHWLTYANYNPDPNSDFAIFWKKHDIFSKMNESEYLTKEISDEYKETGDFHDLSVKKIPKKFRPTTHAHAAGKTDFGECRYGGPAPPDKRHTCIFKVYALDTYLHLKEGYSKQELEDAMKGHILAEAKLTGTYAP